MPPPPRRTPKQDARFFRGLENGHAVDRAAAAAGYGAASVYRWRDRDPAFAKRWANAQTMAADLLAEEADRRARFGTDEPVFKAGKVVGRRRRYSDGLLLARLKALKPADYRDPTAPALAAPPPPPTSVVIREFEMEGEFVRLIRAGRLSLADLEEGPRAQIRRALSQMRDMRE